MRIPIVLLFLILFTSLVFAAPSVTIKRTNPGIAGEKAAEIIYDVINIDTDHSLEGFIWCRSSDDIRIASVMGVASGSGAQYAGPKFEMEPGPSQKAIYITIESDIAGDYLTGCTLKYAPFKIINGTRCYQKQNLEYSCERVDSVFREITLDKTVPFVNSGTTGDVYCPIGNSDCKLSNVIINTINDESKSNTLTIILILIVIILVSMVFYLIRKNH
jgi:hypothetical protein